MSNTKHFANIPLIKKIQHDAYFRCEELNNSVFLQSLSHLSDNASLLQKKMQNAYQHIKQEYPDVQPNVCRIRLNGDHASFLSYDSMLKPHPELSQSIRVEFTDDGDVLTSKLRKENKQNPPILHRVENFFMPGTQEFVFHQSVTKQEEKLGVFQFSRVIGRKNEFQSLLQTLQK